MNITSVLLGLLVVSYCDCQVPSLRSTYVVVSRVFHMDSPGGGRLA